MKKFSRFVHVFKKDDVVALYYSLNHETFYLGVQLLDSICQFLEVAATKGGQETVRKTTQELIRAGFIVDNDDDERDKIEKLRQISHQPGIYMLFLLLTDACNLGCTYCFIEESFGKRPRQNSMSLLVAEKALDLYSRCLKRNNPEVSKIKTKMINLYGGEPLMNKVVLVQTLERIEGMKRQKRLPGDLRLSLNTNGTLVDEEIALILKEHDVEVGVSIDGPREYHNAHRKYWRSEKGSFDNAVRAYQLLRRLGVNVGVSCTIPEKNIDALPDIFKWFVDELGVEAMGFNPILESQSFKIQNPLYPQRVAEAMVECYKIARKVGVYEDRMMRKVKAFVGQYFYDRDCSAVGRQIVVGPKGEIGICPAFYGTSEYFIRPQAGLENFEPCNHSYWQEWGKRLPINFQKCLDCPALGICGGGCPYNAWVRHGSIWEIDDFFCPHALKTLEWLIWDLYDQSLMLGKTS